ncbi:hypothetical protein D9598_14660 [Roseomonas sp. KE0001]|nr:hypothetical protein [Roseomonas sp. KE0001]
MRQRSEREGNGCPGPARRAGGWPVLLLALASLGGCVGSPGEGPVEFYRNAFGEPLQGRPLPPGSDGGYPNLASVPPAPARGAPSAREALSRSLAEARGQSRDPVVPGQPVPPPPTGAVGAEIIPLSPPAPARLAAAPPVGRQPASPDTPAAPLPEDPGAAPAPPPAEFLAPAPPAPELLAPAPPRL